MVYEHLQNCDTWSEQNNAIYVEMLLVGSLEVWPVRELRISAVTAEKIL